ncbi:MAG TPA: hypothetical protein PK199_02670 [Bacteroidales bacterium]|nr:hypothetical protein [Bacteroidales bacterium]
MKKYGIFVIAFFAILSCNKQEGEGGIASIEGVVMIQNVNELLEKSGTPFVAIDEDVYISYGDNTKIDDDITTGPQGQFSFQYLVPGDYTVFAYSDDTLIFNSSELLPVSKQISISKRKDNIKADTILIYKHVDFDDGTSKVSGVVQQVEFYTGTTIPKPDVYMAQNADVFLKFKNGSRVIERIRTSYDGTFTFSNLVEGSYSVYVLSEDAFIPQDSAVVVNFTISQKNQKIVLDTLKINNF